MKIAIASVMLSKRIGWDLHTTHSLHYRSDTSEDEMRGIAIKSAMEAKPGFSVDSVLVKIVDITSSPPPSEP